MDIFTQSLNIVTSGADYAERALSFTFWDPDRNRIRLTENGGVNNGKVNDGLSQPTFWQMAQMLNTMYISWKFDNFEPMRRKIADQWAYIQSVYTPAQLAGDGTDGTVTISDDAVWKACVLQQIHELTGDPKALAYLWAMIPATTARFRDFNHGVYTYGNSPPIPGVVGSQSFVSGQYGMLYAAANDTGSVNQYGLISTSFEAGLAACSMYVADHTAYDYQSYAANTFNWTRAKLKTPAPTDGSRKAQGLYETELVLNPGGDTKSSSAYETPRNAFYGKPVRSLDSTYIGGALAMGVLAARLYKVTGQQTFLDEIASIAAGIISLQGYGRDVGGNRIIANTRDPWTDGFWAPLFVAEALSIGGVDPGNACKLAFYNTAAYIHTHAVGYTYP